MCIRDRRKEAYELIDNTCSEMMASGDSFRQYLDVQGCFDRYSVANAILVSAQMPEATQLKEYSKWKANRVYAVSYTHLDVYKRQLLHRTVCSILTVGLLPLEKRLQLWN